jgi:hypothetical protein
MWAVKTASDYVIAGGQFHFIGVITMICGQAENHVLGSISVCLMCGRFISRFIAHN